MGGTKPFIVQCEKCNKVLSDTTALVLSDKERNILVVKGASNIIVSKLVRDERDGGESEYNHLSCAECESRVGRMFVRTGQHTARLQHMVCLDIPAVKSYQLGVHEMKVTGYDEGDGDGDGTRGEAHALRTTRLEEQMIKVENVMVIFAERMGAMESALRALQSRLDAVTHPSEPVAWGMGGGGGVGGGGGGGGGVSMPMLPGEQQQHAQYAGGGGGGGSGGVYAQHPHQGGGGGGGQMPLRGAAGGAAMRSGGAHNHQKSNSPFSRGGGR